MQKLKTRFTQVPKKKYVAFAFLTAQLSCIEIQIQQKKTYVYSYKVIRCIFLRSHAKTQGNKRDAWAVPRFFFSWRLHGGFEWDLM